MSNKTRTRLGIDARRAQLVEIGLELFSSRPYENVWVEEVAERAGVSRGLLYHYFPTKRDFYVAVVQAASAKFQDLAQPDPELPPLERLRTAVTAYVDLAEEQRHGMLTTHRAGLGADPKVRKILDRGRERQAKRIAQQVAGVPDPPETLHVAIRGWLRLMSAAVVDWLERPTVDRDRMIDFLVRSFVGIVLAARQADPELDRLMPPPLYP